MFQVPLIERVGIDRSIITGFGITAIDIDRFKQGRDESLANASIDIVPDDLTGLHIAEVTTGELIGLKKLTLNAYDVGDLRIAWERNNLSGQQYSHCRLSLNVSNDGNNLQNLTAREYRNRIAEVFATLEAKYGLYIDHQYTMVKELEVNVTIKLDHEFDDYYKVLELMKRILPKQAYNNGRDKVTTATWEEHDSDAQMTSDKTIYAENSNLILKIYNKTQHLSDIRALPDQGFDAMRIEYTLWNEKALLNAFGNLSVKAITDKALQALFWRYFYRDVVKPWEKWHKANQKQLAEIMQSHINANERYWLDGFVRECRSYKELHNGYPVLFDVSDCRDVLRVCKGSKGLAKRYERIKAKFEYEQDLYGNVGKYEEILGKVTKACNVTSEDTPKRKR